MVNVVDRLLLSVEQLEAAISHAKSGLARAADDTAVQRLDSYLGICQMQRRLASQIQGHVLKKNYQELQRLVNLINGLSAMILDDVKVIIGGLPKRAGNCEQYN